MTGSTGRGPDVITSRVRPVVPTPEEQSIATRVIQSAAAVVVRFAKLLPASTVTVTSNIWSVPRRLRKLRPDFPRFTELPGQRIRHDRTIRRGPSPSGRNYPIGFCRLQVTMAIMRRKAAFPINGLRETLRPFPRGPMRVGSQDIPVARLPSRRRSAGIHEECKQLLRPRSEGDASTFTGRFQMNRLFATIAFAAVAMLSQSTASAGGYCGAASYSCCPPVACQPVSCYTTCRIERQMCRKTVMETVWEPEEVVCEKTVYETVWDEQEVTCNKVVRETAFRECEYEVQKVVWETGCREEKYTVCTPVWETSTRECSYTVRKPVWEESTRDCVQTVWKKVWDESTRECRRVVCKPVTEIVEKEVCRTVMKPVTRTKTVCVDTGRWVCTETQLPGLPLPTLRWNPCCLPTLCLAPTPGLRIPRRQWCPNVVTKEVEYVEYCPEVVKETIQQKVCRYETEEIVETIPVKTCRWVSEQIVKKIPVRKCNWVCEKVTREVPHRVCKIVREEKTRKIPTRTCKTVTEVKTRKVPYCVEKNIPYTYTKKVARCVPKTVEVRSQRMVCRQVPKEIEYEVCRIVPVQVCPQMGGCAGACGGSCGTGAAKSHESLKPVPEVPATEDPAPMPEAENTATEEVPSTEPAIPETPASSA